MKIKLGQTSLILVSALATSITSLAVFYPAGVNAGPDSGPMEKTVFIVNNCLVDVRWAGSADSAIPTIELRLSALSGKESLVPLALRVESTSRAKVISRVALDMPSVIWSHSDRFVCSPAAATYTLRPGSKPAEGSSLTLRVYQSEPANFDKGVQLHRGQLPL